MRCGRRVAGVQAGSDRRDSGAGGARSGCGWCDTGHCKYRRVRAVCFADPAGNDALDDDALSLMAGRRRTAVPICTRFTLSRYANHGLAVVPALDRLPRICMLATNAGGCRAHFLCARHYLVISATTSEVAYYPRYAFAHYRVLLVLGARGLADF